MRKTLFLLALLVALSAQAAGPTVYNGNDGRSRYWVGTVPSSPVNVAGSTVYLVHASFSTAAGSGTVTITDRSGDCTGPTDCDIAKAIAIAANTTYEMEFNNQIVPNGFRISASGTVTAHIHWFTTLAP